MTGRGLRGGGSGAVADDDMAASRLAHLAGRDSKSSRATHAARLVVAEADLDLGYVQSVGLDLPCFEADLGVDTPGAMHRGLGPRPGR